MNEIFTDRVPRRRWFRFSLRTLLLLTTMLGVWLGLHLKAVRRQQESIVAIKNLGGWCYYDFQDRYDQNCDPDMTSQSPVPSWARMGLGDDFLHDITIVNLIYHNDASGNRLEAEGAAFDDLKCLAGFPQLKLVAVQNLHATDISLVSISKLQHLEALFLVNAGLVSDTGAAMIANLPDLKTLCISNSRITDASLEVFGSLPNLEHLDLEQCDFTDRGLAALKGMTRLKTLGIGSGITDDGLPHLKSLTNLEQLSFDAKSITPAGLKQLQSLSKLKMLMLSHARSLDISDFQAALPNCQVIKH